MSLDTCPKKADDICACNGCANAYTRSNETRVGVLPFGVSTVVDDGWLRSAAEGWGEVLEAGWKDHVVMRVSNNGVEDDAVAYTETDTYTQ